MAICAPGVSEVEFVADGAVGGIRADMTEQHIETFNIEGKKQYKVNIYIF